LKVTVSLYGQDELNISFPISYLHVFSATIDLVYSFRKELDCVIIVYEQIFDCVIIVYEQIYEFVA